MQFYEIEQLSKNRTRLHNGNLLIVGTPIARTGVQLYGWDETAVKGERPRDTVYIEREEDQVFRPETIASANGIPLVDDHPMDDVVPDNWQEHALGVFFNPRRGEGADNDLLVADLLVTTKEGIDLIRDGKLELSCGYDAKYEKTGPNRGRQTNIVMNHVALVEQGRCGSRCSIGDKSMPKKKTTWDKLLETFGVRDEAELKDKLSTGDEMNDNSDGDNTHVHIHMPGSGSTNEEGKEEMTEDSVPKYFKDFQKETRDAITSINDAVSKVADAVTKSKDKSKDEDEEEDGDAEKIAALKEEIAELKEETGETEDKVSKAKDSALLEESFESVAATAEIIVPGIRIPTFDSAAKPGKSLKAICAFRRKTLDEAYRDDETKEIISDILGGRTFDSAGMSCGAVRTLFNSVGAVRRRANNAARDHGTADSFGSGQPVGKIKTIAELNALNAAHYGVK